MCGPSSGSTSYTDLFKSPACGSLLESWDPFEIDIHETAPDFDGRLQLGDILFLFNQLIVSERVKVEIMDLFGDACELLEINSRLGPMYVLNPLLRIEALRDPENRLRQIEDIDVQMGNGTFKRKAYQADLRPDLPTDLPPIFRIYAKRPITGMDPLMTPAAAAEIERLSGGLVETMDFERILS